ncbi:MAG: hypothetical protein IAE77_01240 [Prosthecobacter sp.]|jgi:hypothetical protein|uniref:hypothetical protein n=1 Tax=Prosthecobacter sp. TaxID=1965333 RepID=UPI0019D8DD31|nr:hypothetical protein [Prosthecobacter sp.]MBE2282065.1 hypothetical protein [Prosthecobacter sp.]
MTHSSIHIGYHGCDRETGERVLAGDTELHISTNDYDWLGDGIYFWENDPERALNWARTVWKHGRRSRARVAEPFVIGAVIQMGNCLDLMQAESIRVVREAHERLKSIYAEAGTVMPQNRLVAGELALRHLDCAVVQFLHRHRMETGLPDFDTVRAAFPEGTPLYETAGFLERTHIQICVRHPASVLGYFRVKRRR